MARVSQWLAALALLAVVPGSMLLAHEGHARGLYAYWLVPVAFGGVLVAVVAALFVVLPRLRAFER